MRICGCTVLYTLGLSFFWLWNEPIQAQVQPDNTLSTPTRIEERRPGRFVVRDGTQRDRTLFHSFREFSIPTRGQVSFQDVAPEVDLVLTRVTGASPSSIDGTLEVLQTNGTLSNADFFLINPNGIIFGPSASLQLGGSFLATTAESVVFEGDRLFSATDPQDAPVLRINFPVGLQFGKRPGPIENASLVEATGDRFIDGLTVSPHQTLALVGGDLLFAGGVATAPNGRIELGSVRDRGFVSFLPTDTGFQLDYQSVSRFADIQFQAVAIATVDGSGNTGIHLQGDRVTVGDASLISAGTFSRQPGNAITIRASELLVDDFSLITTFSDGAGPAGDINIQVRSLVARNGGQIASLTFGAGETGDIRVRALDAVEFSGGAIDRGLFYPSGLLTQNAVPGAPGTSGAIVLNTDTLRLLDGAQISTTTFGAGDAGELRVNANHAELSGSALRPNGTLFTGDRGQRFGSGLYTSAESLSTGDGGDLVFDGNQLRLSNGAVLQTVTFSEGDAGDLTVRVSDYLEVAGIDQEGLFPTSLVTASGGIPDANAEFTGVRTATGQAGNLQLEAGELRVLDGGAIAVGSLNPTLDNARNSGNLRIQADVIQLEDQGRLLAETASGDGGNITLRGAELLLLRQSSQISTTAGTEQTGGDGGDISINADFILSVLQENNDITANAFEGSGGNVNITTESLIGLQFQPSQTPNSDITASSQFGLDGTVIINTLDIDPTQNVVELPNDFVDASQLARRACSSPPSPVAEERSRFYVTGRGGLPNSPFDIRSTDHLYTNWIDPSYFSVIGIESSIEESTDNQAQLVEAQEWKIDEQGVITLVASMPLNENNELRTFSSSCP